MSDGVIAIVVTCAGALGAVVSYAWSDYLFFTLVPPLHKVLMGICCGGSAGLMLLLAFGIKVSGRYLYMITLSIGYLIPVIAETMGQTCLPWAWYLRLRHSLDGVTSYGPIVCVPLAIVARVRNDILDKRLRVPVLLSALAAAVVGVVVLTFAVPGNELTPLGKAVNQLVLCLGLPLCAQCVACTAYGLIDRRLTAAARRGFEVSIDKNVGTSEIPSGHRES